jgi:hypothetical protein
MNLGFGNLDFGFCVARRQRTNEATEHEFPNQSFS